MRLITAIRTLPSDTCPLVPIRSYTEFADDLNDGLRSPLPIPVHNTLMIARIILLYRISPRASHLPRSGRDSGPRQPMARHPPLC